ncbi:unnamed protein product [Cladocopium goreaui]|uniref:alkylglycerone-phosphate synthase n=1 Tax=Cladocopium goreaui TaxID=2562237 RepID=A0A9P1C904_9DINO|nr:unnamed protein product [Cladocopium goreaui]
MAWLRTALLRIAAIVLVVGHASPLLTGLILLALGLWAVRLHPRKTLDMSWIDLLVSLKACFSRKDRRRVEKELQEILGAEEIVTLSVRSGFDLLLSAVALPKGSEVLFVPGITIPSMVQLVEAHGLQPVGVDPVSPQKMLPATLEQLVTPKTKMVVISHLFGSIHRADHIIKEAKDLGLLVVEDCAQGFLGAMPANRRSMASAWPTGFRGSQDTDVSFTSFGNIKTLTALGGGIARVKDASVRARMQELQSAWPVRSTYQRLWTVLRAFAFKACLTPCLYGLLETLCTKVGFSFDNLIVAGVRGFAKLEYVRQQPSLPLLQTLLWRLQTQHMACFDDSSLQSSVAKRRRLARIIIERLSEEGIEFITQGDGTNGWWLLPMLSDQPTQMVKALITHGFDATSTSTQLQQVASAATCKSAALRASDGKDFMNRIVYLPLSPDMAVDTASNMAEAVLQCANVERGRPGRRDPGFGLLSCILGSAFLLMPNFISNFLPSSWFLLTVLLLVLLATFLFAKVAQWFAADSDLRMNPRLVKALRAPSRTEGVNFCNDRPLKMRIDGAVLLTGATGFVGGGILFSLLARASELGVTKIVLMIRQRSGKTLDERVAKLRENPMFDGLRETFDKLVVGLEGDVSQRNFGWKESSTNWPHQETLKAVLHCAGDVRFQQPMQQAAVSLVSATLQMQKLANSWKSKRFLFVSTAFVHAVPPTSTEALQEKLVELRDFDAMELYRDAMSHGSWAKTAMRELGFPNTYTFAKAIAEHLVIRACESDGLDARIVRPSIVGPAWAFPYVGWAGDKPSTIVGAGTLLARRGVRVFRDGFDHPCPVVPVDIVADVTVRALCGAYNNDRGQILHACLDASEADRMPSFKFFTRHFYQLLALKGTLPLFELGFMTKLLRWCNNATIFCYAHAVLNVLPMQILDLVRMCLGRIFSIFGMRLSKQFSTTVRILASCSTLPMQYHPFSSPSTPWRFRSTVKLPEDWDLFEYLLICCRAGYAFAIDPLKGPSRNYPREFCDMQIFSHETAVSDALSAFAHPQASFFYSVAAFVVRLGLSWMSLSVTVDGASLLSITSLDAPLVLCPQHRSVLDFVIIGLMCFQLQPILPLQLPQVAADAEFSNLPFLGWALSGLGAFFVRRGGGAVQPDPALRAKVGRVFQSGRPLEVFLEGLRSRGRRQLRLRTGLLKALRDIAQRTVALVPLAMSYELLPDDESLFREMCGLPRDPLRTSDLFFWVLRGIRGELPPIGEAFMRFGHAQILESSSDLDSVVSAVQRELVSNNSLTTLHCQALQEVLQKPDLDKVIKSMSDELEIRSSCCTPLVLRDCERWPLLIQAATMAPLRRRLPRPWAKWFVEGQEESLEPGDARDADANGVTKNDSNDQHLLEGELESLASNLRAHLAAAEQGAEKCLAALRASGVIEVTEEHLVQELLATSSLPAPLARGAASIVIKAPFGAFGGVTKGKPRASPGSVTLLWPTSETELKDTKFIAQYVDGRPAAQITSQRYKALGRQPLFRLWELFQRQLSVPLNVRDMLPERAIPDLPAPAHGLEEVLSTAVPGRVLLDSESRLRAGTGHGLADIWRLRTRQLERFPDAVVRPETEEEVQALLNAAMSYNHGLGFGIIPVGGRTNVTSATKCPSQEVDSRPMVSLDMRGLSKVLWVNAEDGVAMIEAGITGMDLKRSLKQHGVTMGMEPDSMELSTLGGWIATRASGMKRARYGNIEDMVLEVRLITPGGAVWQRHGDPKAQAETAIGRASTNIGLPAMVLGSEGCLGIITSAIVRVRPLPQVVEYQSVVFPDWDRGASWMREVARMPAGLRPASCRLMDQNQLQLAQALKEGSEQSGTWHSLRASLRDAFLACKGVSLQEAAAVTLVFEGNRAEVNLQKKEISKLVAVAGGIWGGAAGGAAGYTLTFAIAYLRDFGLDYRILSESLETMVPWSTIREVWPAVKLAVQSKHRQLRLPGKPFMSCRMTQLYDEGGVLYMYIAICTTGLEPKTALKAFENLEHAARCAILNAGGCLSHHHGVGKLRASLLPETQSPVLTQALRNFKMALDPSNILAARNGTWSTSALAEDSEDAEAEENPR